MAKKNRNRQNDWLSGKRVTHKPDAFAPLKPIFDTLHDLSDESHKRVLDASGPYDTHGRRLELAVFSRMINSLKSATQLLENGHWEFASPIVRHLYELSLNVEHLYTFSDRDDAVRRYVGYGTLQELLNQIAELEYRQSTGRAVDPDRLQRLHAMTDHFVQIRGKVKSDGTRGWKPSWSGRSTRALAEASKHPMREPQYRLLFQGEWSEQTHGSPVTFIDGVFRTVGATWSEDVLDSDLVRVAQAAMLLQTLYIELWQMLESIPSPNPEQALRWSESAASTARSLHPEQWDSTYLRAT